jgi:predicted PurR-regulated permease PerM
MEMIYYTIAAIVLYGLSDYILNSIEIKMGKRLPNRSFIFLIIITILALISFSTIRVIVSKPGSVPQTTNTKGGQTNKEPISSAPTQILPINKETNN